MKCEYLFWRILVKCRAWSNHNRTSVWTVYWDNSQTLSCSPVLLVITSHYWKIMGDIIVSRKSKQNINGYVFHIPDRRPRFFSEGYDVREQQAQEARVNGAALQPNPPLQSRDRSRSEPAIQSQIHRQFGRELRRISDEFHNSYQALVSKMIHCTFSQLYARSQLFENHMQHNGFQK